ncbi:MAG: glutamate--cysteine ligase [Gammaproteobacteria bacterium]
MIAAPILQMLAVKPALLGGIRRGIEKESLRVDATGHLALTGHPAALGSALTHSNITTDFSEAQLELITDVHATPDAVIEQLDEVHRYVYQSLGEELLWTSSMPCDLPPDDKIPVGRYGSSNVGTAKTIYRIGLGNRYGRRMQTISGIHYNFSVDEAFWSAYAATVGARPTQDFRTQGYFGLIRNFRRLSWLLIYLFGASPALCRSFAAGRPHPLADLGDASLYLPHATSLRMGRLGYQSDAQRSLHVSYNSLDQYARSMQQALTQSYPAYERLGVKVDGAYQQLSTTLLQIENEFYGTIRPKQPVSRNERPLTALRRRGVEYVEVRCLDLNPFLPVGIDAVEIRFIDTFLLYCLLADSPADSERESALMNANQLAVVEHGRAAELTLERPNGPITRDRWARDILSACRPIAELLDQAHGGQHYVDAWDAQQKKVDDSTLTPSARVLDLMRTQSLAFARFALNQSIAQKGYFDERRLPAARHAHYAAEAETSRQAQAALERADQVDFDAYLADWLRLG